MELSVRECIEADEAAVELLPTPDSSTRRRLFGLTHAGALIETSHITLCAEQLPERPPQCDDPIPDSCTATLAGFASFNDQVPAALARWPEVREYLKKRLQFGKPQGCLLLTSFRYDPALCCERKALAVILHRLFKLRPELGGIVLAVHVGVDVEELGVFSQIFSFYDVVELSTGGLILFYRAVRADYNPSIFIRQPLTTDVELEQLLSMVKKNEERRPWFDANIAPRHLLTNQDEHRACFVAQCVETHQPCGLLACTDSIDTDQVNGYARLFSDLYRKSNPMLNDPQASDSEPIEPLQPAPDPLPPAGAKSSIAPAPAQALTPLQSRGLARSIGGLPNIIVLGPSGAGRGIQCNRLVQEFGVVHVCAGDLLRQAVNDESGKFDDVNGFMIAGELVPDDLVQDLVLNRLLQSDCKARGWLLEGYPRTDTQARVLIAQGATPDLVAILELSDDDANQRDGEIAEKLLELPPAPVGRRLTLYREHRETVRQNFVKISTVIHVDAAKPRETTTRKLVHEIYRARGSRGPLKVRNPPRLIIMGAPASGKGTQCEYLVRALHVVHLSTGDMLRQAILDDTNLGRQARTYMDGGQLVPDELIVDVVLERLAMPDCKARGWLLDGFPRTEAQARALLAARCKDVSTVPDCVLALDVPDDEVVKRIAGRRMDPETGKTYHIEFNPPPPDMTDRVIQRTDDTEDTVRTRLQQFHAHSDAIVTALGGVCELIRADGTQPVEKVAEQLVSGAERSLLRNNAAIVSLFSMTSNFHTRAPLFLSSVFDHFKDKDCLLLCLPENCARPAITSGFRVVHGDPSLSTIARLHQQNQESSAAGSRKAKPSKHDKTKLSVLYAFHREELPFLANHTLDFGSGDAHQTGTQQATTQHVIVKGMGVKGLARAVRSWTGKCFEMLGFGHKKDPHKEQSRPRAVSSNSKEPSSALAPDVHADLGGGRNTIH